MKKTKKLLPAMAIVVFVVFGVCCISTPGFAQCQSPANPVADVIIEPGGIIFVPRVNYALLEVTIARPDGTIFSRVFESGSEPYVGLSEILREGRLDCSYIYELRVTPDSKYKKRSGEEVEIRYSERALVQNGGFSVDRGVIVTGGEEEKQKSKNSSSSSGTSSSGLQYTRSGQRDGVKDFVINDDLIVDGSACIGFDCVNGESFGFDTLRLKENNLRIKFDDTSVAASYPRNDWQLTANDSANGGASKFSIDDISGGRTPFTVEANARSHSLYVDDGGRIGIRTSTPSTEIHVIDGDTPTLRLQQDGSSGFAPQTWDVAGNETNFFIRDVTNGSQLPFRIRPDAPTSSIFIDVDGDVGMGTSSPDFSLEVERTGAGATIVANRTDGATIEMATTGNFGIVGTKDAGGDHPLQVKVNGNTVMTVDDANPYITMATGGATTDGTSWLDTSTREAKENINSLTDGEAFQALNDLNPVKFNYKINKKEQRLGFIAEDVPELVAMNGRKNLSTMDILAVLTKVVKEQQNMVQDQQKTISELKERIAELERK